MTAFQKTLKQKHRQAAGSSAPYLGTWAAIVTWIRLSNAPSEAFAVECGDTLEDDQGNNSGTEDHEQP